MITVYIEKIERGGYKFKQEISATTLEISRFYGFTLRGAIRAWRDCYGMQRKHINFLEVN